MDDIKKGKVGEDIFEADFLDFLGIKYINVTNCQKFQVKDVDMDTTIGTYEIKANYKDNKQIIIEEYTNMNPSLGKESLGWFYKSKADLLVFVSKKTRIMVIVPFTDEFKKHYEIIKEDIDICINSVSTKGDKRWQSAFRRVPLSAIEGYYSFYKHIGLNLDGR